MITTKTAPKQEAAISPRSWMALAVLCLGAFVAVLDSTIVNVAIPNMMGSLHAGLDEILWVLNGYMVVYAALLITGGRLGDLYGPRRLFVIGIAVFAGASLACFAAQSAAELIAFRVLQGVGGALLTPQTLALIPAVMPAQRRGAAIGIWSGSAALGGVAGPTVGGLLVTSFGWRAIFLVNIPLGVLAIAGALLLLPLFTPGRSHRLDAVGILLASAGLFAVVFGLVEGQRYNWGSIAGPLSVPMVVGIGVLLLAGFLMWELHEEEPLLPLALFRNQNFALSAWVVASFQIVIVTLVVANSLFFQTVLDLSPVAAGVAMVPTSLGIVLVGPIAGRLSDRVDPKFILVAGLMVAAGGVAWLTPIVSVSAGAASFVLPLLVIGCGLGCVFAVIMTLGMRGVADRYRGAASGVLNTCRQVGGALGAAITAAVLQSHLASGSHLGSSAGAAYRLSFVSGLRVTLAVMVVVLVTAGIASVVIERRVQAPNVAAVAAGG